MDFDLLIILSGLFGIFCIGREIVMIVRVKQISVSNLFLIMYGITFGIVVSIILILYDKNIYQINAEFLSFDYSQNGINHTAWWLFAAVMGYFSFRFAGRLRFGNKKPKIILRQEMPTPLRLYRLQITSVICLLIGVASFIIWTSGWGGYGNLFLNAAEIRNGSYGIKNPVAFFAKPAQIIATVSIISVYLIKQKKNTAFNTFLFIISFLMSLMYYFAKDGRMVVAMYLLIILFMWDGTFERQAHIGKKFISIMVSFALFVLVVLNMDSLTHFFRYDTAKAVEDVPMWQSILDELSYIYVAGQTSVEHCITQGSPLLIGHDVGSALFAWVPSALTPDGFINVWDYNTYLIAGKKAVAQYPTDIISTSLYDLGILGPLLLPAMWGIIISKLERSKRYNNTPLFAVLYYSLSMTLIRGVNYSMLSSSVASVFHIFVTVVVFWMVSNVKLR